MLLFVLGPVVLGVAHVGADLRYLVLRRQLPRWVSAGAWLACAALFAVRVLQELRVHFASERAEWSLVLVWVALALVAGARRSRSRWRLAIGTCVLAPLGALALRDPVAARVAFVHVHNLVALALWLLLFRDRLRSAFLPVAVIGAALTLLLSGAFSTWVLRAGQLQSLGLHLLEAADWVAPNVPAQHAISITLAYVFLQSIHYVIWLVVIPQEDLTTRGTLSFRMSLRSLRADFGRWGLCAIALAAGVVLIGALAHALRARGLYLSLAMFHGYLELAMLAYFWAAGGAAREARADRAR